MECIKLDIEEQDVLPLSERLMNSDLRREGYDIVENPTVTILPGFVATQRVTLPEFESPHLLSVSGIKFWPDIEDPMIVMLDVSEDMVVQLWRDEILTQIGKSAVKEEMRPPHITLFKAGEFGDEYEFTIDPDVRNQLLDDSEEVTVPDFVRATDLRIDYP